MVIVLVVMWIMLMVTLFLSSDQIQKVKDKTVKNEYMTWELYKKCIDDLKGFSSPVKFCTI